TWSQVIGAGCPGLVFLRTRASHFERTVSKEAWTPLGPLEGVTQLRRCDIEQREVVVGQPPVPARADCQRADPFISGSEPADFDPEESERSVHRMTVDIAALYDTAADTGP